MPDRKKAIKGLECLTNEDPYMSTIACAEKKCPYAGIPDCNLAIWHDALELLKGQEPVEPIPYDFDTPVTSVMRCYKCGCCNADITAGNPYCWHCGRPVRWDD